MDDKQNNDIKCEITKMMRDAPEGAEWYFGTLWYKVESGVAYCCNRFANVWKESGNTLAHLMECTKIPSPWYNYVDREVIGLPPVGCLVTIEGYSTVLRVVGYTNDASGVILCRGDDIVRKARTLDLIPLDWDRIPRVEWKAYTYKDLISAIQSRILTGRYIEGVVSPESVIFEVDLSTREGILELLYAKVSGQISVEVITG